MGFLDAIFPPGKMDLVLPKASYAQGEKIAGTARLTTSKPVKARSLIVRLYATERITKTRYDSKGRMVTDTDDEVVFDFPMKIDGEKEYTTADYPFEIAIPSLSNPLAPQGTDPGMLQMLKTISSALSSRRPLNWRVEAKLDIAGGRDIRKETRLNIA